MTDLLLVKNAIPMIEAGPEMLLTLSRQIQENAEWANLRAFAEKWYGEEACSVIFSTSISQDEGLADRYVVAFAAYGESGQRLPLRPELDWERMEEEAAGETLTKEERERLISTAAALQANWNDSRYNLCIDTLPSGRNIPLLEPPHKAQRIFVESPT